MRAVRLRTESGRLGYLYYARLFVTGFFVKTGITDLLSYQCAFNKNHFAVDVGDAAPFLIQRFYSDDHWGDYI
jgi:hypothetical protein